MKLSKIFRQAVELVWDGGRAGVYISPYICITISHTYVRGAYRDKRRAIKVIEERLGNYESVGDWLQGQGIPAEDLTTVNVQAHRKAWCLKLAEEFEAKGD